MAMTQGMYQQSNDSCNTHINSFLLSAWSKPFFITTSNDTNACVASPSVTPTPSATMLHDRLSGATMSASIDILGDDGQPVHRADSASNSLYGIATPVSMLGAAAISALVLTF